MPTLRVNLCRETEDRRGPCRPLRAGCVLCNPRAGMLGTLGGWATSDGADRWLVSCYHVLARPHGDGPVVLAAGEPIVQPDGSSPAIATTDGLLAMPLRRHDFAAARLESGAVCCPGFIGLEGAVDPTPLARPRVGMRVVKSGAGTGVTLGVIIDERRDDQVDPPMWTVEVDFDDDEPGHRLVAPGDSGAFWLDRETGAAVAMHTGETMRGTSSAVVLEPLLERVGLRLL